MSRVTLYRLKELEGGYTYQGEQTCAADGMCQVKCPVGINTGELIKSIRADQLDSASKSAGYGISQVECLVSYHLQIHLSFKCFAAIISQDADLPCYIYHQNLQSLPKKTWSIFPGAASWKITSLLKHRLIDICHT